MRLVVKVPAHSEHGPELGLAEFTVTDMFLERLDRLASVVRKHRLHSLTTFDAVDVWSSNSFAAAHRLTGDEMVVTDREFRFTVRGRATGLIQTVTLDIGQFAAACRQHQGDQALQLDDAGVPAVDEPCTAA